MIYLNVSYEDRHAAKKMGARFDGNKKKWYAPSCTNIALIEKYGNANLVKEANSLFDHLLKMNFYNQTYSI